MIKSRSVLTKSITSSLIYIAADWSSQVPVQLPLISALSKICIFVPPDLRPLEARQSILLALQELESESRFPQGIPKLDPVKIFAFGILLPGTVKAQCSVLFLLQWLLQQRRQMLLFAWPRW